MAKKSPSLRGPRPQARAEATPLSKAPVQHAPEALTRIARAYWRGEMPLWGAFWVYGMFLGTLLGLIMTPVSQIIINQFQLALMVDSVAVWLLYGYLLVVMFGFWGTYYLWHVVGVWRCARNPYGVPTVWGWAARAFVLLVTFTYWPAFFYVVMEGF
jgi:hypothetical protein